MWYVVCGVNFKSPKYSMTSLHQASGTWYLVPDNILIFA